MTFTFKIFNKNTIKKAKQSILHLSADNCEDFAEWKSMFTSRDAISTKWTMIPDDFFVFKWKKIY